MYSAERSNAAFAGEQSRNDVSSRRLPASCRTRIMARRYALTSTAHKYLEIGINASVPPSYVEIAVGDHRGHELVMSLEAWNCLHDQRHSIYNLLRDGCKDPHDAVCTRSLTAKVCTIDGLPIVRLIAWNVTMMMTESTLRRMFAFDDCINTLFADLSFLCGAVDVKWTLFSNIAATVSDPEHAANGIRASKDFDAKRIIDCELLALIFTK